ncbi:ABC transporter permease [Salmonella enterica subsp. enterica]|nr:ABC transporter permease [Salmonella enterica subsp. enterica]
MLYKIAVESFLSLIENKRKNMFFLLFVSITMTASCIISSSIDSVRKQAENELRVTGENIISVDFTEGISGEAYHELERYIHNALTPVTGKMKKVVLFSGEYPWGSDKELFSGVDDVWLSSVSYTGKSSLSGNELITSENQKTEHVWYVNAVPFIVAGHYRLPERTFLSGLGLDEVNYGGDNYISFKTAIRYTKNNDVDSVRLIFPRAVNENDILILNKRIQDIKGGYKITSVLSAKRAVDNVINSFALLYGSTYVVLLLLNIMVSFSTIKRNFLERKTEIGLKVIYGIRPSCILLQFVFESIYLVSFVLILSLVFSYMISFFIFDFYFNSDFAFSTGMLFFFFGSSLLSCVFSCLLYTRKLNAESPVDFLKEVTG